MFCVKCGNELKEDSKFCSKCGSPVDVKDYKKIRKKQQPKNRNIIGKKTAILILGISAFVIITTVIIFDLCFNTSSDENDRIVCLSEDKFKLRYSLDEDSIELDTSRKNKLENEEKVYFSEDGEYMYYFSDIDSAGDTGTLCKVDIEKMARKSIRDDYEVVIDQNVNHTICDFNKQIIYRKNNELYYFDGEKKEIIAGNVRMYRKLSDVGVLYVLDNTNELYLFDLDKRKSRKLADNTQYIEFVKQECDCIVYWDCNMKLCVVTVEGGNSKVIADDAYGVMEVDGSIFYIDRYASNKKCNSNNKNDVTSEKVVKEGDVVNIDFVGRIDGKEFDGGSAEGYELEIGSGLFIEGFEDGLIGHKAGDEVLLELMFPENYAEELSGKKVDFMVTINSIYESGVSNDAVIVEDDVEDINEGVLCQLEGIDKDGAQVKELFQNVIEYSFMNNGYLQIIRTGEKKDVLIWSKNDKGYIRSISLDCWDELGIKYLSMQGDDLLAVDINQDIISIPYDESWASENPDAICYEKDWLENVEIVERGADFIGTDKNGLFYTKYKDDKKLIGDVYYCTKKDKKIIAKNIEGVINTSEISAFGDGKIFLIQELDSDKGRLVLFNSEGNQIVISDGVSMFKKLASDKIIYISKGDLYLYDGETTKLLEKEVENFWSNNEMESEFVPYNIYSSDIIWFLLY